MQRHLRGVRLFLPRVAGLTLLTCAVTMLPGCDGTSIELGGGGSSSGAKLKATTVTLNVTPTSATAGQSITLTAKVSASDATGNAVFLDENSTLGSVDVKSGVAALSVGTTAGGAGPFLNPGTHSLAVAYDGDNQYASSGSGLVVVAVTAAGSTCGLGTATQSFTSGITTLSGGTYSSAAADQSALCATNPQTQVFLSGSSLTSSASRNPVYDASGIGAAVLAYGSSPTNASGAAISLTNSSVSSSNTPALAASGAGSQVIATNSSLLLPAMTYYTQPVGYGVNAVRAGTISLNNVTALSDTGTLVLLAAESGNSQIVATGGSFTAKTYVTEIIGTASVSFLASALKGVAGIAFQPDPTYAGAMGTLQMIGGTYAYTGSYYAPAVYVANGAVAGITLNDVSLQPSPGPVEPVFLQAGGSYGGAAPAAATLSTTGQAFSGNVVTDTSSSVTLSLTQSSSWTGAFNGYGTPGTANISLDQTSSWNLTASCAVSVVNDAAGISGLNVNNIIGNGYTITYVPAKNPTLGGLSYTLKGGGTLKPLS